MAVPLEIQVDSLLTEPMGRSGQHSHYVVKNTAFNVILRLPEETSLPLRQQKLLITLVYDSDKSKVDLELSQKEHVEYTVAPPNEDDEDENNSVVILSVRLKILSSQVQNSLFCLHAQGMDASENVVSEGYSEPIRVVSKPDQIRKKRAAMGEPEVDMPPSKRRARGEEILQQISSVREGIDRNLDSLEQIIATVDRNAENEPIDTIFQVKSAFIALAAALSSVAPHQSRLVTTALNSIDSEKQRIVTTALGPFFQEAMRGRERVASGTYVEDEDGEDYQ